MKSLKELFGKRGSDKDTTLLAPVRMQAAGILTAFLENKYGARVTLTQLSTAVFNFGRDRDYYRCEVYMQAFFYYDGMEKRHGRMYKAPIPPCVIMRVHFKAHPGNLVLKWTIEYMTYGVAEYDMNFPGRFEVSRDECWTLDSLPEVRDFVQQFNEHRPVGFSIMPSGHDQVIWNINPKNPPPGY